MSISKFAFVAISTAIMMLMSPLDSNAEGAAGKGGRAGLPEGRVRSHCLSCI